MVWVSGWVVTWPVGCKVQRGDTPNAERDYVMNYEETLPMRFCFFGQQILCVSLWCILVVREVLVHIPHHPLYAWVSGCGEVPRPMPWKQHGLV